MKIKKHGKFFPYDDKDKSEKFVCDYCDCVFSVKEDEYYKYSMSWYSPTTGTSTTTYTYYWPPKDILICSCPDCHKICKKEIPNYSSYSCTTASSTYRVADDIKITLNNSNETNTTSDSVVDSQ